MHPIDVNMDHCFRVIGHAFARKIVSPAIMNRRTSNSIIKILCNIYILQKHIIYEVEVQNKSNNCTDIDWYIVSLSIVGKKL